MAEAAEEAGAAEEEEEAQDDNFSHATVSKCWATLDFFLYRSCLWYPFLINRKVKRVSFLR